jgi:membrane protease YdiL (CAAX protease family)
VSGRLIAWLILIGAQIALAYGSRAATEGEPDRNAVYHYSLAAEGFVQYAIILGIVLLIARPIAGELLALRKPHSWGNAAGPSLALIVGIYVLAAVLEPFLHPGREQGLTPTGWDSSRAGAFAASFVVIAVIGPFVEEAMFRGLGYSLLAPYGSSLALVVVGLTFGLVHGLVDALPVLVAFGAGLAYLRARTDSLYPCFVVHALFNAIALTLSVTT